MADKKSFAARARDHATDDDSPHAHQGPEHRRRWADVLKHRWPTGVAIAVVIFFTVVSRVLGEEFETYFLAWVILLMPTVSTWPGAPVVACRSAVAR